LAVIQDLSLSPMEQRFGHLQELVVPQGSKTTKRTQPCRRRHPKSIHLIGRNPQLRQHRQLIQGVTEMLTENEAVSGVASLSVTVTVRLGKWLAERGAALTKKHSKMHPELERQQREEELVERMTAPRREKTFNKK
jgi:hypothetical protein